MAERARWRSVLLLVGFALCAAALEGRILYLQLVDKDFLAEQANDRHLRTVQISAHRGSLTDRYGEPLAVSTPVDTIYANPKELKSALDRLGELAAALDQDDEWLARRITSNLDREFVFLAAARAAGQSAAGSRSRSARRRHGARVPPLLPGRRGHGPRHRLHGRRRPRPGRPRGRVRSLAQRREPGSKRVHAGPARPGDSRRRAAAAPRGPGRDLRTSIDLRLQYLAYRELKAAVADSGARSGSVVVLDPRTGEVLAMVNQPSYNPNDRVAVSARELPQPRRHRHLRARLELQAVRHGGGARERRLQPAHASIDTSPGALSINNRVITRGPLESRPHRASRPCSRKSSNVGAARVALDDGAARRSRDVLTRLRDRPAHRQRASPASRPARSTIRSIGAPIGQATLSYGYGVAVTTLQLARAYAAIAADGVLAARVAARARRSAGRASA